jgi:hypothetical protein
MLLVWILVMIADIAHMSALYHNASVAQIAWSSRDHGRVEKTAPPQKVA